MLTLYESEGWCLLSELYYDGALVSGQREVESIYCPECLEITEDQDGVCPSCCVCPHCGTTLRALALRGWHYSCSHCQFTFLHEPKVQHLALTLALLEQPAKEAFEMLVQGQMPQLSQQLLPQRPKLLPLITRRRGKLLYKPKPLPLDGDSSTGGSQRAKKDLSAVYFVPRIMYWDTLEISNPTDSEMIVEITSVSIQFKSKFIKEFVFATSSFQQVVTLAPNDDQGHIASLQIDAAFPHHDTAHRIIPLQLKVTNGGIFNVAVVFPPPDTPITSVLA